MKNLNMANKGKAFEDLIKAVNEQYFAKQIANVEYIETPWKVTRVGKRIVNAFPYSKSTLDFRGVLLGGQAIAFDCKETIENDLPLKNIKEHQIECIRNGLNFGEKVFILAHILPTNTYYFVDGNIVLEYWDAWQNNKRKRGFNSIKTQDMIKIVSRQGIYLDYLEPIFD
jgi:recombination protein U